MKHGNVIIPPEHELFPWMNQMIKMKSEGKLVVKQVKFLEAIWVVWLESVDGVMQLCSCEGDIEEGTPLYNWIVDTYWKEKSGQLNTEDKSLLNSFQVWKNAKVKSIIGRSEPETTQRQNGN